MKVPELGAEESLPERPTVERPSVLPQAVVMPLGVIMACHFLNFVVGFAFSSLPAIIGGVVGVLCLMIFWAILNTGYRMAWQYGRLMLIIGMLIGCVLFMPLLMMGNFAIVIHAVVMWFAFTMYRGLRSKEALKFFNLLCPKCESKFCKPKDIVFKIAQCEHCGHEW